MARGRLRADAMAGLWAVLAATALPVCAAAQAQPPPAVTVATIRRENVAPVTSFIGRVSAIQSVQIVARVTAFIDDVPVKQGSDVAAGDVIYQLQTSQYEADVKSAQAQLQSAQAGLRNTELAYGRASQLNRQGFEAQATLDTATVNRDQAQAAVLTAQANLALAALNLSYCTIRSPIDGRIGAITLTKGNLLTPSTPALATVNQLDPIRVVFAVSDRVVVRVKQENPGSSQEELAAGLAVDLTLGDGSHYPHTGKIAFVANQVDPATGTVSVYADFPNPQRLLLPGAYVNVDVRREQPDEEALVPLAAVQTDQNGSYVLTVGADGKVAQVPITIGRQIAQSAIVSKGLNGGERVIVEGVQKVRPGQVVAATEPAGSGNAAPSPSQTSPGQAPPGKAPPASPPSRGG
jgi:membrane fusion protein (multidrug efflux system)